MPKNKTKATKDDLTIPQRDDLLRLLRDESPLDEEQLTKRWNAIQSMRRDRDMIDGMLQNWIDGTFKCSGVDAKGEALFQLTKSGVKLGRAIYDKVTKKRRPVGATP